MPRKTTPSILEETLSMQSPEEVPPVADLDEIISSPPKKRAAKPKTEARQPAVEAEVPASLPAAVEAAQEGLEVVVEPVQDEVAAAVETVSEPVQERVAGVVTAVVEPVQEKLEETLEAVEQAAAESPAEQKSAQGHLAYRLAHTMVLASLGMLSYALEIVHILVERGELSEQEGKKLVGELSRNARTHLPTGMPSRLLQRVPFRRKKNAPEAVEAGAEFAQELTPETEAGIEPVEAPENGALPEEEDNQVKKSSINTNTNILTVHFLSIGSPVVVEPDKPKKPKEKK